MYVVKLVSRSIAALVFLWLFFSPLLFAGLLKGKAYRNDPRLNTDQIALANVDIKYEESDDGTITSFQIVLADLILLENLPGTISAVNHLVNNLDDGQLENIHGQYHFRIPTYQRAVRVSHAGCNSYISPGHIAVESTKEHGTDSRSMTFFNQPFLSFTFNSEQETELNGLQLIILNVGNAQLFVVIGAARQELEAQEQLKWQKSFHDHDDDIHGEGDSSGGVAMCHYVGGTSNYSYEAVVADNWKYTGAAYSKAESFSIISPASLYYLLYLIGRIRD